jgi:nucleotide-binding universal stress UspA family protein
MNVLFCSDGSDASYHALGKVLPFLSKDSLIDVFHVIDWGYFPTYVTFPTEDDIFVSSKEVAKIITEQTEEIISTMGFKVNKKESVNGNAASQILEKIGKEKYDLLIMGSHGKKGIENWLGSVSSKVVSASKIPVFIARPSVNENVVSIKENQEIIFATDGSSFSYNAIKKTAEVFDLSKFSIDIITVSPGIETLPLEITMDQTWMEACIEKQKEIANEIIAKTTEVFEEINVEVRNKIVLEGNIAEKIIKYTEAKPYDLIIMGSHGREGFSEFLLGSTSKRVLNNISIPVLIIPFKK